MDSIDRASLPLTPVERAAAEGDLPAWAVVSPKRRLHIARVAELLETWARNGELAEDVVLRWRAAGYLHDALRDADPTVLADEVGPEDRTLPGPVLHGPAAALRLDGEVAPNVALAIRYHTVGHPDLDELGRALYLADFLEPGRQMRPAWCAELRARMPADAERVLIEVLDTRIRHLLDRRVPIRPETAAFWSVTVQKDTA